MPVDPNLPPVPPPGGYPPQGYGQPGMQQPGYPQQAYGAPAYASWGRRVGAALIDGTISGLAGFPLWIGYIMLFTDLASNTTTDPVTGELTIASTEPNGTALALILLGALTGLAVTIWNVYIKGGRTGWTIGKGVLGIRLLGERDGQPIGAGMAFVRQLLHIVDQLPCYLGYLWPIWDSKRQTFADKILSTIVIEQRKP